MSSLSSSLECTVFHQILSNRFTLNRFTLVSRQYIAFSNTIVGIQLDIRKFVDRMTRRNENTASPFAIELLFACDRAAVVLEFKFSLYLGNCLCFSARYRGWKVPLTVLSVQQFSTFNWPQILVFLFTVLLDLHIAYVILAFLLALPTVQNRNTCTEQRTKFATCTCIGVNRTGQF